MKKVEALRNFQGQAGEGSERGFVNKGQVIIISPKRLAQLAANRLVKELGDASKKELEDYEKGFVPKAEVKKEGMTTDNTVKGDKGGSDEPSLLEQAIAIAEAKGLKKPAKNTGEAKLQEFIDANK